MSQMPALAVRPPTSKPRTPRTPRTKVVTRQKCPCQCQCRNPPAGRLAICNDAIVGRLDPELVLCDVCFFELKEVNPFRRAPTCQYPPDILDKVWGLVN